METEVSSTISEESNNLKNNINIVQPLNTELTKNENIELQNNESSESFSNETKIVNNKSGASPKLLEQNNTNTLNSSHESEEQINGAEAAAGDCQYFFEDEIFRIDKRGRVKFGLVFETPGTYSGDEDDEFEDSLKKGDIRVLWCQECKESVESENSIGLVDRSLVPGDVVRKNENQRGYCRDINVKADVKVLGTKYVIKNVNVERLRVISRWQIDGAVCLDSWVGSIRDVNEKAILRTASGCRIEISSNAFYNFQDLHSRRQRDIFEPIIFYPGNTIIGSLPPMENINILTPDIPLHTNKKGKPLSRKFTVESLYTDCVWVDWQCKALSEDTDLENITLQPNPCVQGDDLNRLKRLNFYESSMLQIVDRNYLTYSSCDTLVKISDWDKEQSIKFIEIYKKQKEENQNNCMRPSFTSATGTAGSHHHYEKLKKKLSLSLDDKSSSKLKRNLHKTEKLGKRESSQEMVAHEKSTPKSKKDYETDWFSAEDEDEVDESNCDVRDVDKFADCANKYLEDDISTTTTMSTCSSSSPHTSPSHLTKRQMNKKARKNFKKPFLKEPCADFKPKEGDELVTEALLVYSTVTVVWQDGTIESDIPSTLLYPIHHLDNHEFFPGDFVVSAKEDLGLDPRDYGVIQTVDHDGRIARVKWFATYTSTDDPKPTYKGETECSVYDLKDQPDFVYRPGTMVLRVANFVGEDAKCTAGQVIDNGIDGRVKVWWVDGHISQCYPQDLFEVGQLDQGDVSHASEDSWETESENSEVGCGGGSSPKLSIVESDILTNIEKAYVALDRLQEVFNINPNLQNPEVMRKLLIIYKSCRFLDRLLNTTFFHEDNFMGLIERVRKAESQSVHDRAEDQKTRVLGDSLQTNSQTPSNNQQHPGHCNSIVHSVAATSHTTTSSTLGAAASVHKCHQSLSQQSQNISALSLTTTSKEFAPRVLFAISSTLYKCSNSHSHSNNTGAHLTTASSFKKRSSPVAAAAAAAAGAVLTTVKELQIRKSDDVPTAATCPTSNKEKDVAEAEAVDHMISTALNMPNQVEILPNISKQNQLLNSVMINIGKVVEKTHLLTATCQDDSGNYSRNDNFDGSSTSYTSSSDLTNIETNVNENQKSSVNQSSSSIELTEEVSEFVCLRLCSMLKEQLVKCRNEICEKYYKDDPGASSDILKDDLRSNEDDNIETIEGEGEVEKKETVAVDRAENGIENLNPAEESAAAAALVQKPETNHTEAVNATEEEGCNAFNVKPESFQVLSIAPKNHKYHSTIFHPNNAQKYNKAVQREYRLLKTSLPPGVYVKVYEDRMDLISVMIEGPTRTPYEGGIFLFDIQLGREYPKSPPNCYYISYCSDRLNPNLYEDGKVCVSLLGTWIGKDTEMWGPNSTLLQVIVSIQGLILVPEPYFNEAGYEKQKGTQQGKENSRMYNEMVVIKLIQSMTKLIEKPPEVFQDVIKNHFKQNGMRMYERIKVWMELSQQASSNTKENLKQNNETIEKKSLHHSLPDFPLVPASRGFCLTLSDLLENFKQRVNCLNEFATAE